MGRSFRDRLCADVRRRTWSIFNHERLTEQIRQPLSNYASRDVSSSSRSEAIRTGREGPVPELLWEADPCIPFVNASGFMGANECCSDCVGRLDQSAT
jgi:hypothetical protein